MVAAMNVVYFAYNIYLLYFIIFRKKKKRSAPHWLTSIFTVWKVQFHITIFFPSLDDGKVVAPLEVDFIGDKNSCVHGYTWKLLWWTKLQYRKLKQSPVVSNGNYHCCFTENYLSFIHRLWLLLCFILFFTSEGLAMENFFQWLFLNKNNDSREKRETEKKGFYFHCQINWINFFDYQLIEFND